MHCVSRQPPGVINLTSEAVTERESLPNLSRMLAGFLTRTGHPVATDELLRVSDVPGAPGFSWQYTEEGTYHRLWLFGNLASWLLIHFVCPKEHYSEFHQSLTDSIKTLRLHSDEPDTPSA